MYKRKGNGEESDGDLHCTRLRRVGVYYHGTN